MFINLNKNKMFKKIYDYVDSKVLSLMFHINRIESKAGESFVECDTCGCLLKKQTAFRGKPKMEKVIQRAFDCDFTRDFSKPFIRNGDNNEYRLQEVYFCKIHKPKSK
jgi:hypothetical protein